MIVARKSSVFLALALAVLAPSSRAEGLPAEVHTYFSDQVSIQSKVLELIDAAKVEILVNQRCFTNPDIAKALLRAKTDRKVLVYVLLEPEPGLAKYATPFALNSAGITVRLSQPAGRNNNRYLVVDGEVVATGSYEWTLASEKQKSESLTILPGPTCANEFIEHFRRAMGSAIQIEKVKAEKTEKHEPPNAAN